MQTDRPAAARQDTPMAALAAPLTGLFPASRDARILVATLLVLSLWVIAIAIFGIPALLWPMKLIVPGIVLALVLLTWGM
jgi:hypothetical protein